MVKANFRRSIAAIPAILAFSAANVLAADIDFEGLDEGQVVDKVSAGAGVSGNLKGHVNIFGFNPAFGMSVNAAIVFDSDCPPTFTPGDCSGEDPDLGTPNETFGGPGVGLGGEIGAPFQNDTALGNILIVAEDLVDANNDGLVDDPDDADLRGQFVEFDFRPIKGGKTVTVNSVAYIDNDLGEFDAHLEFFGPGTLNPSTIGLAAVGDNGVNTVTPGIEGVTHMRVVLNGSGGVEGVTIEDRIVRPCWVTTGGFNNSGVVSGPKQCTFGGNIGPPPSGALEVNFHDGAYDGLRFHTNDIRVIECVDEGSTGPQQPGGKKGLQVDTLYFDCTGRLNNVDGYTCAGFLKDAGEPQGKKGNDHDAIHVEVYDSSQGLVAECSGELDGGNVQIHPPVGN